MLKRKRLIRIGVEGTKGTVAASITTDLIVFDLECMPEAEFIERKGSGRFLGHTSPGVIGDRIGKCTFKTELISTAANIFDPAIEAILSATGFAITSNNAAAPVATIAAQETLTINCYEDGRMKQLLGCSGTVKFTGERGKQIFLECEFSGFWQTPTAVSLPEASPSAVTPARFGSGAFSLASSMDISKFELDMGNQLVNRGNHFVITDRDPVVSIDPEDTIIATYDWYGKWIAGTTSALSLTATDGESNTFTLAAPAVQFRELSPGDRDGLQILDLTGQCNISSGNDEVTLGVA